MLEIRDDEVHDCFVVEPSGKLTEADFEALAQRFDARIAAGNPVPNLVIHARDFPGWADFGAMFAHVGFIRDHQRQIEKIALVSDSRVLELGPKIARHFVAAEIRHFPEEALAAALDWVAEPQDRASHVSVIDDLPDDVVGLSVHGVVSARDYAETIVPLVEAKLRDHADPTALPNRPRVRALHCRGSLARHPPRGAAPDPVQQGRGGHRHRLDPPGDAPVRAVDPGRGACLRRPRTGGSPELGHGRVTAGHACPLD